MGSTTSNYAIPYPANTDYVTDGAQNMQDIAQKVDDILTAQVSGRNLLYNGAMQVHQRGTSASSITTGDYRTVDRFFFDLSTMGTWTQTVESSDAPTGSGFRKSLKTLCTTADATPSANDYQICVQRLEGQDLQGIRKGTSSARKLTLSFWVKSNKTGTYIAELYDVDNSRQVSKAYTINSSATWEFKTVTFPADTIGAFDNDNARSLDVIWWLGAGSTFSSGTLNTNAWASITQANRAAGQANLADATNNYWQVTGTQLTIGDTTFPFQFKSFAEELQECQRYYEKSYAVTVAPATANTAGAVMCTTGTAATSTTGIMDGQVFFATSKRSGASVVVYDPVGNINKCRRTKVGVANNDNQSTTDISSDPNGFYLRSASGADANTMTVHYTAASEL